MLRVEQFKEDLSIGKWDEDDILGSKADCRKGEDETPANSVYIKGNVNSTKNIGQFSSSGYTCTGNLALGDWPTSQDAAVKTGRKAPKRKAKNEKRLSKKAKKVINKRL